jgi:hypothetical protein
MNIPGFSLLLFSVDPEFIRRAVSGGVAGIIVDWESAGKRERQAGADTEINGYTIDDLRRVRRATDALVICRINQVHRESAREVEQAIDAGADELLVPMVRQPRDVETILEMARGRCPIGILVETPDAVRQVRELDRLPLSRMYVGLNDLAIEQRRSNLFRAVVDGTVRRVREACSVPFGFAGLTLPECGFPIPCRLLIAEMARLDAQFSFLRRSFHRDTSGRSLDVEVPRLLDAIAAARCRTALEVKRDQIALDDAVLRAEPWLARPA